MPCRAASQARQMERMPSNQMAPIQRSPSVPWRGASSKVAIRWLVVLRRFNKFSVSNMFQFTILLMFFWLLWRFNIIFYSRFLFLLMVVFIINGYFRGYGIRVINKWWESTKLLVGCYKGLYWFIGEYHDLHVSWFNLHFVSLNLHVSCFNLHFPCWNLLKSRFFLLKSW